VENLLSNMETQTQDDLLLCINSCTQTGTGTSNVPYRTGTLATESAEQMYTI
jgi:hypothetical protein